MERTTSDHGEIKRWAEERGGTPAIIDHPHAQADKQGIRIDFPGTADDAIKSLTRPASWDEFFRVFEDQELLLAYDDETAENPADWYHFEKRGQPETDEDLEGYPPADIAPEGFRGPLGYEEEADEPEGDWPEGSEHKPGTGGTPLEG